VAGASGEHWRLWLKSSSVIIQMKVIKQYFAVVLFANNIFKKAICRSYLVLVVVELFFESTVLFVRLTLKSRNK